MTDPLAETASPVESPNGNGAAAPTDGDTANGLRSA